MEKTKLYAIILAGGRGSRMGSDIPKQYLSLKGKPVLAYCFEAFEESSVDKIFAVCEPEYEAFIEKEIIEKYGITKFAGFAANGRERVYSVSNGIDKALEACKSRERKNIYLLIHDGARPVISKALIERCLEAVKKYNAVVPGLPLKDTIKQVSGDTVELTPDRRAYVVVQTPQCFRADVIAGAFENFKKKTQQHQGLIPTDDASLVEMFTDVKVHTVPGNERNLKLTSPVDMRIAELFLS